MKAIHLLLALSLSATFVAFVAPTASACAPIENCIPGCQDSCPPGCGDNVPCCGTLPECVPRCVGNVCIGPITCSPLTCPIIRCALDPNSCVVIACGELTCPVITCVENLAWCFSNPWCNSLWCYTPVN